MSAEGSKDFGHLFSGHAAAYATFRPRYPAALYDWLAALAPGTDLAWDVGTGNGQVAVALASRFARVHATDPSAEQLANAEPHARVRYERTTYATALAEQSVQLVTVGQALHWFDLVPFFAEVRRVLAPGGVFAAFAYTHSTVTPAIDELTRHYHDVTVGAYWAPEHHLIHAEYRTLALPIREVSAPTFEISAEMSLAQYLGFLRTWSSAQRLIKAEGEAKVLAFEATVAEAWGAKPQRLVRWPLILRVGTLVD